MTPAQRTRCQWRRCYRAVLLLHCDRAGERFVVVGLRVLHGDQAEAPPLWELVATFVRAVGRGVMKVLILDRGFIDGPQIGRLKTKYGIDSKDCYADGHEKDWLLVATNPQTTATDGRDYYHLRTDIEERHRQVKCFWDLTRFHSTAWNLIVRQAVFVALTHSLLQRYLLPHGHQELNRRTIETTRRLLPDGDRVIVYRQPSFAFFTLLEHTALLLSLQDKARRKALAKTRRLQKDTPPS